MYASYTLCAPVNDVYALDTVRCCRCNCLFLEYPKKTGFSVDEENATRKLECGTGKSENRAVECKSFSLYRIVSMLGVITIIVLNCYPTEISICRDTNTHTTLWLTLFYRMVYAVFVLCVLHYLLLCAYAYVISAATFCLFIQHFRCDETAL